VRTKLLEHRRRPYSLMYDALTRHYAAMFRGTLNPFHREWQSEQHRETLDNDEELIRLFENVKAAERCHCELRSAFLPVCIKFANRKPHND
jgi:hypothetical protein